MVFFLCGLLQGEEIEGWGIIGHIGTRWRDGDWGDGARERWGSEEMRVAVNATIIKTGNDNATTLPSAAGTTQALSLLALS